MKGNCMLTWPANPTRTQYKIRMLGLRDLTRLIKWIGLWLTYIVVYPYLNTIRTWHANTNYLSYFQLPRLHERSQFAWQACTMLFLSRLPIITCFNFNPASWLTAWRSSQFAVWVVTCRPRPVRCFFLARLPITFFQVSTAWISS